MEKNIAIIKTFCDGTIDYLNEVQWIKIDEIDDINLNN